MQSSFYELEYAAKKKQTRRDIFLNHIEQITPWASLTKVIAPHYPEETVVEDNDICKRMHDGRRALFAQGIDERGSYQHPMETGMAHFHQ